MMPGQIIDSTTADWAVVRLDGTVFVWSTAAVDPADYEWAEQVARTLNYEFRKGKIEIQKHGYDNVWRVK